MLRLLLTVSGCLAAASLAWMMWGLLSPGDYFAGGNPTVWGTLLIAGMGGGYMGSRLEARGPAMLLLVIAAFCVGFWLIVPDGWWAAAPRPMPSAD
jgi:hypothetical protein